MSAVDFDEWVDGDLVLTLRGRTYRVPPRSVGEMGQILAAAARGEVNLGLAEGEVPAEVQAVLDTIKPGDHPALGDAWQQMIADNVPPYIRNRMAYYAVFYWARGKEFADRLAVQLWVPRDLDALLPEAGEEAGPKGS